MDKTKNSLFTDQNITKNSFWSIGERIIAQIVSFIISVVLARLLAPNDYGVIALIQVLINICSFIIEKGFGQALIQKKNPDVNDYSSVLIFCVIASILFYILIYRFSLDIANFFNSYDSNLVSQLIKFMGLSLPISSVNLVQKSYVSKHMMFAKFFWATLIGTITSGAIGIIIALNGGGPWALGAQYLINLTMDTLILFIVIGIKINGPFSLDRIKSLFSFGWKIVVSGLFGIGVDTTRSSAIAKKYTPADLAHYNKAESLPKLIVGTFSVAVGNVMFPALSDAQDDLTELKYKTRKFMRMSSYIVFPAMIGMFAVSDILIPALFGSQWTPTVDYLKIFTIIYISYPLSDVFLLSTKAIKKSGLVAIIEIITNIITFVALIITINYGTFSITIGYLASTIIRILIQSIILTKTINYTIKEQLIDFLIIALPSLMMGAIVYFLHYIPINKYALLVIQIITGISVFVLESIIFKMKEFYFLKSLVTSLFKRSNK